MQGRVFVLCADGVFQVEDDHISPGGQGLREPLGPVSRNEEKRTSALKRGHRILNVSGSCCFQHPELGQNPLSVLSHVGDTVHYRLLPHEGRRRNQCPQGSGW